MLPYDDLAGFDENNEYNENPLRYGVYRRGFVVERLRLSTTSQALRASSPSRGALGMAQSLSSLPKPPLLGEVASSEAMMTERFSLQHPLPLQMRWLSLRESCRAQRD